MAHMKFFIAVSLFFTLAFMICSGKSVRAEICWLIQLLGGCSWVPPQNATLSWTEDTHGPSWCFKPADKPKVLKAPVHSALCNWWEHDFPIEIFWTLCFVMCKWEKWFVGTQTLRDALEQIFFKVIFHQLLPADFQIEEAITFPDRLHSCTLCKL